MAAQVLVVMALQVEEQGVFEGSGAELLFTGLGKVNAAYALTRRLIEARQRGEQPLVVNFGTVGSQRYPTGSLVACRRFIQRDMDVTPLGFEAFQTPFEELPRVLELPPVFRELPDATCATGDRFDTSGSEAPWDVVDMEAYALAKVCLLEQVPFACAKYVTDGADHNAHNDWHANLPRAARAFLGLYRELVGR